MGPALATSRVTTELPFACGSCGFRGVATVIGEGVTERESQASALDAAEGEAWADAVSSVAFARCPACGARDEASWRRWLVARGGSALLWALVVGAAAGVGLFLLRQEADDWPLRAAAAAGTVTFLASFWAAARAKRASARSVAIRLTGEPPTVG